MADHVIASRIKRTTHREQPTCAIEHRPSWRQSSSCDLNQVLSLRGSPRSTHETPLLESLKNRHKV
jgi:hypothetical protein